MWRFLSRVLTLVLVVLVVWRLLESPGTRLTGLIILAVLLGVASAFAVPALMIPVSGEAARAHRRDAGQALLLAGACLSVGVLAIMGSIERDKPEYVWKYGEPVSVAVPLMWRCTVYGSECVGSWMSGGEKVRGRVTLSHEERRGLGLFVSPDEAEREVDFDGRVLGARATTAGFHARPESSVVLGKVPAWLGWAAGGLGLAVALFTMRSRGRSF